MLLEKWWIYDVLQDAELLFKFREGNIVYIEC